MHIPAETFVPIKPSSRLLIVNASLGRHSPNSEAGRAVLQFTSLGCSVPCVATLVKDIREHVRLEIILEANVDYAFAAKGP
ncbi:hypothetical protein NMY22_g17971 [Coprinellus aureogranulatus]|nr:hypothetical protein NMY22_g17971 [Coprinellus aureogranulatus]